MLHDADRDLALRDRQLPGLAVVLDDDAVAERLAPAVPGLRAVRVSYVRYKPATSVVAGLTLLTDTGPSHGFAAAYHRAHVAEKLAKVPDRGWWRPCRDDGIGLVVAGVEADRTLRGVRRLLAGRDPVESSDQLTPLRYKPGRRWVGIADGRQRQLVKVHSRDRAGAAVAAAATLPRLRSAGVACPPPRHLDRHRGIVSVDWVDGVALEASADDRVAEVAQLLAALHGACRPAAPVEPGTLRPAVDAIGVLAPHLAPAAETIAARTRAVLATERAAATIVHGDFSADQVIDAGSGLWLTDFDRMRVDDPVCDIGSFVAARVAADVGDAVDWRLAEAYRATGRDAPMRAVRAHTAAALLARAVEPFRRREPDWLRRMTMLLRTAGAIMEVTDAADPSSLSAYG